MNRRDAAFLAHLDALDARWTQVFGQYHTEVMAKLDRIQEDIAGIKMDLATHRHDD